MFQAPGKKSVSFEKSVSFSDDPPPLPISILNRRQGGSSSSRTSGVGASTVSGDLGKGKTIKVITCNIMSKNIIFIVTI